MGAVKDRLQISVDDMRSFVRTDAINEESALISALIESAKEKADEFLGNDFDTVVDELLGRGDGATRQFTTAHTPAYKPTVIVDGVKVSATVNSATGEVTLDTAPIAGARITVDYETDALPIPDTIRIWVMRNAARMYENRPNGVRQQSDPTGFVSWGPEDYADIWRFRRSPGW